MRVLVPPSAHNVTAARDAGVHLAFFSGNEIYWKTRWGASLDGSGPTDHRTLVCYKEGKLRERLEAAARPDPLSRRATGSAGGTAAPYPPRPTAVSPTTPARDRSAGWAPRVPSRYPAAYRDLPLWRNTSIATLGPEETATLPSGTLGYEWDFEQYAGLLSSRDGFVLSETHSGR